MSVRFIQFLQRGNFLATWKKSKVFARAAMGGKSAKTEVLPGFGKIEHGGSSAVAVARVYGLVCQKSAVAALSAMLP